MVPSAFGMYRSRKNSCQSLLLPFVYVLQYAIQPTSTWIDIKLPNKESNVRGVKMSHYENPTVMPRNRKQA